MFTQTKMLFRQPLTLLSPSGGIGGERINEDCAQAAGMVHDERLSESCMLSQTLNGILPENDVSTLTLPSPPRGEGIKPKDAEASAGHKQKPQP